MFRQNQNAKVNNQCVTKKDTLSYKPMLSLFKLEEQRVYRDSFEVQCRDHKRLNPYRFETKFYDSDQSIEIYASYHLSNYQFKTIQYGIHQHGLSFNKKIKEDTQFVIICVKDNNKIIGIATALSCSDSFFISSLTYDHSSAGLAVLEHIKKFLCARSIDHASTDSLTDENEIKIYQQAGFSVHSAPSGETICKIVANQIQSAKCEKEFEIDCLEYKDHDEARKMYDSLMSRYPAVVPKYEDEKYFGFFMQNANNQIIGGVIGIITHRNQNFNLTIDRLWIDSSLRGNNFSRKLIHFAEVHAIERGCRYAFLHTMEYHAPWLYPKLNYKPFFTQKIGKFYGFYYEKKLSKKEEVEDKLSLRNVC